MTRRLVILEGNQPDELPALADRQYEVRCDQCRHWKPATEADLVWCRDKTVGSCAELWVLHSGHMQIAFVEKDPHLLESTVRTMTRPDFGCASFSPLAGAEGERK